MELFSRMQNHEFGSQFFALKINLILHFKCDNFYGLHIVSSTRLNSGRQYVKLDIKKKKKTSQLRHIFCNQSLDRQSMKPMSSGLFYALVQSVEY